MTATEPVEVQIADSERPDGASVPRRRIAYVAGVFPSYSETFVYREVRELRRRGWEVETFGLHTSDASRESYFADLAKTEILYDGTVRLIWAILAELGRRPWRSLRTLATALCDVAAPSEHLPLLRRLVVIMQAFAALAMAGKLRDKGIRHVHCHFAHAPSTVGMYAALQLGIPFSFTGHANDIFQRRVLLRHKLQRAAFVGCISLWHRRLYQSIYPDGTSRYALVRCGVDTEHWRPEPEPAERLVELRVMTVCRLVRKKGVDLLIQAMNEFGQRHGRAWSLTVVGEGPELGPLQTLCRRLGCQGSVVWKGLQDNDTVRELMAGADLLAVLCRVDENDDRDGIPVVLMEAMARGVPVLAGDLPAIRELVDDEVTGICVNSSRISDVADRVAGLADDAGRRHRLAQVGRQRVVDEFSQDVNIGRLETAFARAWQVGPHGRARMRLAYLNTQYPSLSHTFIEREVKAVRARGVEIQTFSIRQPRDIDQLSDRHRQAAVETCYLLPSVLLLAGSLVHALVFHARATIRAASESQGMAPPGVVSRVLYLAYCAEGIRLAHEMESRGLRHIHVHMANNGAAVARLACQYDRGLSYSLSIHGSAEFFQVNQWRLAMKAEGAVFVRCISHFCQSQVMAWTSPDRWQRYHIVHCGVDARAFAPRPPRMGGPLRILTVGRLDPIKGYPLLLQACHELSGRGVEWQLDMVGDGPLRDSLAERIEALGIGDHVTLAGAVGQDVIQHYFDKADVMVVSSFMEGVPVVLMEAMAKQMAVVATKVGGIPELISNGQTGILVTPGSVSALADALEQLVRRPELLAALGPPARQKILAEYSVEQLGDQMVGLFRKYCTPETPSRAVKSSETRVYA